MTGLERPNLLYIHSDQHTPFVTGCYGDPIIQTPNLDRLAANGVIFDNAYCCSPICVPARMSMLTGQHPYQNQVWTNDDILDSAIPTLAHALGAAGYHPILIGRMHALGPDQLHGYVERLVGDHGPNYIGGRAVERGILDGTAGPHRISLEKSGPGQSAYQVHDEYVTAATVDYLNRLGVQKKSGRLNEPFCITVGFMLPHPPYVARREDYDLYQARMTMPKKARPFAEEHHPHLRWWRQHTGIENVTEAEILRARAAYWGLVSRVDAMIGQILAALRQNELDKNTLIIYTSDHGDMVGEHGLWWKHTFYEEAVKIPLIMVWPEVIPAGQRCGRVVSALDINATILDALDAPALPNASGRTFLGLITDHQESVAWEDVAFSEYCQDRLFCPEEGCYQRMLRRDEWKLIYYHGQQPQLFNLAEDPEEQINRAGDPACQEILKRLTAQLLDGWNPIEIAAKMTAKRADNQMLEIWARQTHPPDHYRWDLKPDMNYLDEIGK
jgi:choline-sulfatase